MEKAGVDKAIISAHAPPKGFIITTNRSYSFVFEKDKDGHWNYK